MPLKLQHEEVPALNLTPMIDVLFLLIIFFMAATNFGEPERNIDVAVPTVADAAVNSPPPQPLVVTVYADGRFELDSAVVTLEELVAALRAARAKQASPSVVIRGDAECAFQQVASALAACQQAGIAELGITVRIAASGNGSVLR